MILLASAVHSTGDPCVRPACPLTQPSYPRFPFGKYQPSLIPLYASVVEWGLYTLQSWCFLRLLTLRRCTLYFFHHHFREEILSLVIAMLILLQRRIQEINCDFAI